MNTNWQTGKPKSGTVAVIRTRKAAVIFPRSDAGNPTSEGVALAQFFNRQWLVIPTDDNSPWPVAKDVTGWKEITL